MKTIRSIIFILLALFSYRNLWSQELTIYTIPSPKPLDWQSPKKVFFSYFDNLFTKTSYGKLKHPIGHTIVELKDSSRYALIGMTANSRLNLVNIILRKGYGLGILSATINGKIEESDKNTAEINKRCINGDVAFIRYLVRPEVFERLWQYREQYHQKGYDKIYNGLNRPREGLGAGCSAFAVSFTEVGGLDSMLPKTPWKIGISIPDKLIGGPPGNNKKVQFFKLFFAKRWANKNKDQYQQLEFYDPSRMFSWINQQYESSTTYKHVLYDLIGNAKGLVVDCSDIPVPDEPIWLLDEK